MKRFVFLLFLLFIVGCTPVDQELYDEFCQKLGYDYSDWHVDTNKLSKDFDIKVSCEGEIQDYWRCEPKVFCSKKLARYTDGNYSGGVGCIEQKVGLLCFNKINNRTIWIID